MDKRGSHVGVVISFVVFIVFLVFLYSITEPALNVNKDKQFILEHLKTELVKKVSGELIIYSFKIKDKGGLIPSGINCFKINSGLENFSEMGSIVVGDSGIIGSKISTDGFLLIDDANPRDKFYKAHYSKEFANNNELNNCEEIISKDYAVGSLRTEEYIFESKILNLISEYGKDYDNLKTNLGIPKGSDFSFSFINKDGGEIKTFDKNLSVNIYAEKIDLNYIDNNANINKGIINIKVW